jgi:type IV pilus assembly protein PilW
MSKQIMRNTPAFPVGALKAGLGRGRLHRAVSSGFSLVELLVAVALSLVIMTALIALYANMSRNNNEMRKSNELIENGRFAIQLLQSDLVHAGFWGNIPSLKATAVPDACLSYVDSGGRDKWPTNAAELAAYKINLMAIPVQGYVKGSDVLENCGVTDAKVQANSSMLVVRHANTCEFGSPGCPGGKDKIGPHIQISGCGSVLTPEAPYVLDGVVANFTLREKDCDTEAPTVAPRRKLISNVYYVGLSDGVPNLMRVSMVNGAYAQPEPLVEGIEAFHLEYGVDTLGSNGEAISLLNPGDGNPDIYVTCPAAGCSLDDLEDVVAVKLHVLSRNLEPTTGYVNNMVYHLGAGDTELEVPAFNDAYKRHVFSTTVRLVNIASRREAV